MHHLQLAVSGNFCPPTIVHIYHPVPFFLLSLLAPLENYQNGADCWYVYKHCGTKRKFVEEMLERTNEMYALYPEEERQRMLDANPHMFLSDPNKYDLE